jgi:hypothetical protein
MSALCRHATGSQAANPAALTLREGLHRRCAAAARGLAVTGLEFHRGALSAYEDALRLLAQELPDLGCGAVDRLDEHADSASFSAAADAQVRSPMGAKVAPHLLAELGIPVGQQLDHGVRTVGDLHGHDAPSQVEGHDDPSLHGSPPGGHDARHAGDDASAPWALPGVPA